MWIGHRKEVLADVPSVSPPSKRIDVGLALETSASNLFTVQANSNYQSR